MSRLYFSCNFQSQELRSLDLPIEVRRPSLALVARTLSSRSLELESGIYHVTATLPAGQGLYNRVEVVEGEDSTVLLIPEPEDAPPNGRQEVQHYIWGWPDTAFQISELEAQGPEISPKKLRAFRGNVLQGDYNVRDDEGWLTDTLYDYSSHTAEFKVRAGSSNLVQLLQPGVPPINMALPVSHEQTCQLILLRLPNGLYTVDANVEHLVANTLLRYVQRGFLAQAATMTASHALEAELLLSRKKSDPIAAAIGAYALLRLGNIERLHDWTENLKNWFEWLPDGIAIRGEHLARLGAHDQALAVFLDLPSRGLPIFSEGLSYVIDRLRLYLNIGKSYFEKKKLSRAQALLGQLQRFAILIDFRKPLVTYKGIDPGKPDEEPLGGDISPYRGVTIWSAPPLSFLPEDFKRELLDGLVDSVLRIAERAGQSPGGKMARTIRQLSSQNAFSLAFDQAIKHAVQRFMDDYTIQDEDLVGAIITNEDFWQSKDVRQALVDLVLRQGPWPIDEQEDEIRHFVDILPQRVNRERVDKAVNFLLHRVLEEINMLPGPKEIRDVYRLQFQKMGFEAEQRDVELLKPELQAETQLSDDIHQALLQLTTMLEQHLLKRPLPQVSLPRAHPYHNLPQPSYTPFVGRQKELDWFHQHLAPSDRAWQMVITGMGGVGKSALALLIGREYLERYNELPEEERFDAIIWTSAKEEAFISKGRETAAPSGVPLRILEDMYTTISQTLKREDITRAISEERERLVQKALSAQRTLLIVDNLEDVADARIKTFLRSLPPPTKCIVTSRQRIDLAAVIELHGLPPADAERLIIEEARIQDVKLKALQRRQLLEHTKGLPLPIKLSVVRMASGEAFKQVIQWLSNAPDDSPEYYYVRGQMDVVRQNSPDAWKILLACSFFDQDACASREALGSIVNLSIAERDQGLALLQRLSLLNRNEADRFWMSPLVQECVAAELDRAEFAEMLANSWLDWLLKFTQVYGIDLDFHAEDAPRVGLEYPNLLKAIRWSREQGRWETLLQLAEGTWFYFHLAGLFSELREILEAAVLAAKALQDKELEHHGKYERLEGRYLRRLGLLFMVQGQYDKALEDYLERAEEIARKYQDEVELGLAGYTRSNILFDQNRQLEAEQIACTMLEIGERLMNPEMKVLAILRLSEFASKQGHFVQALKWLDQGEEWALEMGWSRGLAWIKYRRAVVLLQQGKNLDAEPFLEESLRMGTSWGELRLIARSEYRLAEVYEETHRVQRAFKMVNRAHDSYERLGMNGEWIEMKEYQEVIELLRRIAKKTHDSYQQLGMTEESIQVKGLLQKLPESDLIPA